jgi:hypothetical protein
MCLCTLACPWLASGAAVTISIDLIALNVANVYRQGSWLITSRQIEGNEELLTVIAMFRLNYVTASLVIRPTVYMRNI